MALTEPLAITVGSVLALPRISDIGDTSTYVTNDRTVKETIQSRVIGSKRNRFSVRLDKDIVAADPITALNTSLSGSVYVVVDFPTWGFTQAQKLEMTTGLFTQLQATSNAMLIRLMGLEH